MFNRTTHRVDYVDTSRDPAFAESEEEAEFLRQEHAFTAALRWYALPVLIALCTAFAVLAVVFRPIQP
jgi:hypothetical protein